MFRRTGLILAHNHKNKINMKKSIQHLVSAWKGHEDFAAKIVEILQPKTIVDLGVDYGFSTFAFALPNIGHVFGIDWFKGDSMAGERNTLASVKQELENLKMYNVTIIDSKFEDAAKDWKLPIDILHIDGAHDYDSVKRDYLEWSKFVSEDGVILMHDTESFSNDVGRFFREIELPKHNFLHSHGLGVICKNQATLDKIIG